jgi:hypothetical protein
LILFHDRSHDPRQVLGTGGCRANGGTDHQPASDRTMRAPSSKQQLVQKAAPREVAGL